MQPERTALAWRRTGLSMFAGSIVATRVFGVEIGPFGLIPTALAVILAIIVIVAAEARYRRDHRALMESPTDRVALSGGGMVGLVALATLLLGLLAAGLVVAGAIVRN